MEKKNKEKILDPFGNEIIETKSGYKIVSGSVWKSLCNIDKGLFPEKLHKWKYEESDEIKLLREQRVIFVNDAFIPLWNDKNGLLFLDGGYGSSKTTYAITKLLIKCQEEKYFRCFYGRQKKTEARQLHQNIITEIKRNGWADDFDFSEKPTGSTQIYHKATGNSFIMFGCDDVDSLKGWDNPTDILVDEINQIDWETFGMLFTRLRGQGYETQLMGLFNNCDVYPGHWLLNYIYIDDIDAEFAGAEGEGEGEDERILFEALMETGITRHHSTYLDNKFQNAEKYYYSLVVKAGRNPLLIKAYCDGDWGVKLNGQPYYKDFEKGRHVKTVAYDPDLPLHISFDENTNPYFPCLIIQVKGTEIRVIDEVIGINPNNKLTWICREIKRRYENHDKGLYIYGDATSKKESTLLEQGKNLFTMAKDYLWDLNPTIRKHDSNPNNKLRQDFINIVFAEEYDMICIKISPNCKKTIEDMMNVEENPEGSKGGKNKAKVMVNGIAGVQRWGHCGDALEYMLCEAFRQSFLRFQKKGVNFDVSGGGRVTRNSVEYAEQKNREEEIVRDRDYVPQEEWRRVSRNGY